MYKLLSVSKYGDEDKMNLKQSEWWSAWHCIKSSLVATGD